VHYLTFVSRMMTLLVLPTVAAVVSVIVTANERPIQRPAAAEFLIRYWDQAVRAPQQTWLMLDPEWRQSTQSSFDDYVDFLSTYSRIEAAQVRETDRTNYFEVSLTFTPRKAPAKPVTEHLTYGLRCRWMDSHLPFRECDAEDLTIFDGYNTGRPTAP
jgi:hypothetical protein